MAEIHQSYLDRLCRLCGKYLQKRSKIVTDYAEDIYKYIHVNCSLDKHDTHPSKICYKCIMIISNLKKVTQNTTLKCFEWTVHSEENCYLCCTHVPNLRKGGNKKCVTVGAFGRPSEPKWTVNNSLELSKRIPIDDCEEVSNTHLLEICKCEICGKVAHHPTIITLCEHIFCLKCILPKLEGLKLKELKCPKCEINCTKEEIYPSEKLIQVKKCIISLSKSCSSTNLSDNSSKNVSSIKSIFDISTSSKISPEVNKAVAHVIKVRLKEADNKLIKLPSGGPRVRSYLCNVFLRASLQICSANYLSFRKYRK